MKNCKGPLCRKADGSGTLKDVAHFNKHKGTKDGLQPYCRDCHNPMARKNSWKAQKIQRDGRDFGLDDYDAIFRYQGGACPICPVVVDEQDPDRWSKLVPDHDHDTCEVRALVCVRCNQNRLGAYDDDPAFLEAHARYLRAHNARERRSGDFKDFALA